jgi:putative polyketide hydroxylase
MRQHVRRKIESAEVVVVGAGPAGLTAAIALARAGVETLLIERRERPSSTARATTVSTASMELMRAWGLEPPLRAGGIDLEMRPWVCDTLATAAAGRAFDAGFPSREQSALISPTSPACVPQSHLEPVLEDHLRSLAAARIERGIEVVSVEADSDGVSLTGRETDGGREMRFRCRFLVAADGIQSTVRGAVGIRLSQREELGERLAIAFRAPLWDTLGPVRNAIYIVTGTERPCFFVPTSLPDRWLFGAEWDTGTERLADVSPARAAELISSGAGDARLQPRIEWIGTVPYGVHLAERFRQERVLLIGDAAHRVTPRGATGLNTAIGDGHDVGWKLAWVLRGWAGESLLDTYEAERRPVAEHNVARSSRPHGSEGDVVLETKRDLGGRIAHVWQGRVSTLDLVGDGLTLFTGPDAAAWWAAAGSTPSRVPLTVDRLDAMTARALGVSGRGALLVRPDGRPAALWSGDDGAGAALRAAVGSATALDLMRAAA